MSDQTASEQSEQARTPAGPVHRYTAALAETIETRWQAWWDDKGVFVQPNPGDPAFVPSRPKYYVLDMFPYPSGAGLHVGHPEGYTATDIIARYKRMQGFNVLHPMGWDAFGLPAEQYAIQTGVHPEVTTRTAIDNFRRQLKRFGFCYDWSREFGTIDEDYYKWTQWIFLRLYRSWFDPEADKARPIDELVAEFEAGSRTVRLNPAAAEYGGAGDLPGGTDAGAWASLDDETRRAIVDSYRLAYVGQQTVNWCPKLGTALANEEVIDGKSERGGFPVLRKPLRQWMLRITAYADRLHDDLATVDWPNSTKVQQSEWIGRSEGAEVGFPLLDGEGEASGETLRVFTTRPDTAFGATYMVVAPEHPLVEMAIDDARNGGETERLRGYVEWAKNRTDIERQEFQDKTGVFTGVYALNPVTEQQIPVWTSDYVLMSYGTGAIMAVPGQDQRDWDFAEKFGLPIVRTVQPPAGFDGKAFAGDGAAINSSFLDGLGVREAKAKMIEWMESKRIGAGRVNYRLRDWLFSRQRYWGEPFPIVYDARGNHYAVGDSALPVRLPKMTDYQPVESDEPQPLLGKATEWLKTTAGEAGVAGLDPATPMTRETNTMPGWAGSCWYHLRYCGASDTRLVDEDSERYWMGRSALRADPNAHGHPPSALDSLPPGAINAAGFIPRDPYPPGEYGPAQDLIATTRNLPHFELPGATYFVTWRTAEGRQLSEPERQEVLDSLLHFDGERCRVYSACVMPDHVHWLVRPFEGHTLGELVSSVKRYSARQINTESGADGSLWQADRFDHVVRDERWFGEFVRYIVGNPVEAGLVGKASAYAGVFLHGDVCVGESRGARETIGSESRSTQGGVDLYIGGSEHAVLHLLYARFWHKVLFDLGHVSTPEPYQKLFHQGLITSFAYQRGDKSLVPVDEVEERGAGEYIEIATGEPVAQITAKMSKSLKNVVNPDDVIAEYGADTMRLYEMYMGPLEASKPWNTKDTIGLYRFLQRAWRLCVDEDSGELKVAPSESEEIERALHKAIAKVGEDIERLSFNTAIAAMIEFVNTATPAQGSGGVMPASLTRSQIDRFARVLAPFAPHMGEELWHKLGRVESSGSIAHSAWPEFDAAMLVSDTIEIPVQILGKVRSRVTVPADADQKTLESAALDDPKIKDLIAGKTVRKVIVVPGRLVNIVAN